MFIFIPIKYIIGFLLVLVFLYLLVKLFLFLLRLAWPYIKAVCAFLWCRLQVIFAFVYQVPWLALLVSPTVVLASVWFNHWLFSGRGFCASWDHIVIFATLPLVIGMLFFSVIARWQDGRVVWSLLCSALGCHVVVLGSCWGSLDADSLTLFFIVGMGLSLAFLSRAEKISREFFWWGLIDLPVCALLLHMMKVQW